MNHIKEKEEKRNNTQNIGREKTIRKTLKRDPCNTSYLN